VGDEIYLTGSVVQPSPTLSVMQLDELEVSARVALVSHGIEDAAPSAPRTTRVSQPEVPPPEPKQQTAAEVEPQPPSEPVAAPQPAPVAAPEPAPPAPPAAEPARETITATEPAVEVSGAPEPPRAQSARPLSQGQGQRPILQTGGLGSSQTFRKAPASDTIDKLPPTGSFRTVPGTNSFRKVPGTDQTLARISMTGNSGELDIRSVSGLSGPVGEDTESVLPSIAASGDFGRESWRDVLLDFYSDKATGVIVIHAFRENRWCYIVDGRPTHYLVDHSHPGEYLSDAILKECEISTGQWTEAVVGSKISGIPAGEYLVKRGIITQRQLHEALRQRTVAITRNLLGANFGAWSYHPWTPVRDLFTWEPIDLLPLILNAERKTMARMSDEEITKLTEPHLDEHVTLAPEREALLRELPLTARERTLAEDLLPGGWSIKEMMVHGGMFEKDLLRFMWVLRAMGFVRLQVDEGPDGKRNRAERKLYVVLKDILRRPDFEALHCHWTAIESEIIAGHHKTVEEFSRQKFEKVMDPRLGDLIDRIHIRADELLLKLKSKQGRDSIRRSMVGESQLIMASDLTLKQGDMEAYKSNFGVARVCYERVLELAPRIHETKDARVWAKKQLRNPTIAEAQLPGTSASLDAVGRAVDKYVL
jgi:hypothetical protein